MATYNVLEDLNGLERIAVDGAHEPSRLVSSDRNECQVKPSEVLPNLLEGGADGPVGQVVGWRRR
jgi:hypothetical protein